MNKIIKLALVMVLAISAVTVFAQTTAPIASIIAPANNSNVTLNQAVTFTAASAGSDLYSYNWDFGGTYPVAGQSVSNTFTATGTKTITLTVRDTQGRSDTDTVTVNIGEGVSTTLTITNIRVTDITTNSAVIRWTTNLPSDSRVIYDTVSHPSIAGVSGPGYGYANSTETSDTSTKVTEHAVTVSGLAANTHYYFRVISAE